MIKFYPVDGSIPLRVKVTWFFFVSSTLKVYLPSFREAQLRVEDDKLLGTVITFGSFLYRVDMKVTSVSDETCTFRMTSWYFPFFISIGGSDFNKVETQHLLDLIKYYAAYSYTPKRIWKIDNKPLAWYQSPLPYLIVMFAVVLFFMFGIEVAP